MAIMEPKRRHATDWGISNCDTETHESEVEEELAYHLLHVCRCDSEKEGLTVALVPSRTSVKSFSLTESSFRCITSDCTHIHIRTL